MRRRRDLVPLMFMLYALALSLLAMTWPHMQQKCILALVGGGVACYLVWKFKR